MSIQDTCLKQVYVLAAGRAIKRRTADIDVPNAERSLNENTFDTRCFEMSIRNRFTRPHTEIAEWYWLTEYLDYSNKPFTIHSSEGVKE